MLVEWKWKSLSCVQLFATPWIIQSMEFSRLTQSSVNYIYYVVHHIPSTYIYSPWNSPGQNTGAGSLSLLQGSFPTQGSNPGIPHCRRILYQLSHRGSPLIEWEENNFSWILLSSCMFLIGILVFRSGSREQETVQGPEQGC